MGPEGVEGDADGTTLGPPVGIIDSEGKPLGRDDGGELGAGPEGAEGDTDGTTLGPPVGIIDSEGKPLGRDDGGELGLEDGPLVG